MENQLLKKTLVLFSTAIILLFGSCKKDPLPAVLSNTTQDTLRGKEFIFNDLTWEVNPSGTGFVYLTTPVRRDLFRYRILYADVSIKFDNGSIWTPVESGESYYEDDRPYLYFINVSSGVLSVTDYTFNYRLIGKKAAIKVKFL